MNESQDPDISPVIAKALAMEIPFYLRGTDEYESLRPVHNLRIDTWPQLIAPCRGRDDMSFWLGELQGFRVPISIRSGGHHHEAMCSNTGGVVLISNTEVEDIEIADDLRSVWVGAGQRLRKVIHALGERGRVLPTGGCGTVNVGGLTHGGGWGMSYRTWGLTSDALREVEMVLPNGDVVCLDATRFTHGETSLDVEARELFWALRGGGGGNFGAVTRFKFEIFDPGVEVYTEFTLQWSKPDREKAVLAWIELCGTGDERLNTFGRLTVLNEVGLILDNPPLVIGGRFYGNEADCREALDKFLTDAPKGPQYFKEKRLDDPVDFLNLLMLSERDSLTLDDGTVIPPQGFALQVGAPKAGGPRSTCIEEPEPHKVSSTMPDGDHAAIVQAAIDYIDGSEDLADVNMYLSLHGMGGVGAGKPYEDGAFPWRDKPYMLQVQAWWNPGSKTREEEKALCDWVVEFRRALERGRNCGGAFINFPDRTQGTAQYYGGNWGELRRIKGLVDPGNRLGFAMGIDLA